MAAAALRPARLAAARLVGASVLYGPFALVSAEVVALYLLVASRFGVNVNELFAGQGIQDYKGFLRMHIAADGTLTDLPDRRSTGAAGGGGPTRTRRAHAPWIEPASNRSSRRLHRGPDRPAPPSQTRVAAQAS